MKKSPSVTYNKNFSKIAKNLVDKLLQFETIKRYNVYQANRHPWITRCNETAIPETVNEAFKKIEIEDKLKQVMQICFACSIVKNKFRPKTDSV